jgi:glucose-1-phosphate cytidylyltransferase
LSDRGRPYTLPLPVKSPSFRVRDLPVVILCGGQGTRLREETEYRPKPMVEIGGQPILWHIMKNYGVFGARRFILCLGYRGWDIKQYFLRYNERRGDFTVHLESRTVDFDDAEGEEDWQVTLAETGAETATGARLRRIRRYIDTESFFLTYGDAVGDVDIEALLGFHQGHGRIGTVTGVYATSRYGEMIVDGTRVREFHEKLRSNEALVNGGFFVFDKSFFDYLDDDPQLFFELAPLQKLCHEDQLQTYVHDGAWYSMDTYRDYLQLNSIWASGEAPWKSW